MNGSRGTGRQLISGPFHCANKLFEAHVNTTCRRLGLDPDRAQSYPLPAVRKPAPTVAGDRRDDAEGDSSARASSWATTRARAAVVFRDRRLDFYLLKTPYVAGSFEGFPR